MGRVYTCPICTEEFDLDNRSEQIWIAGDGKYAHLSCENLFVELAVHADSEETIGSLFSRVRRVLME